MKKIITVFVFIIYSFSSFSQIAPQKDFTDKLSAADKKIAEKFLKGPRTYNGDNYDLKYHRMNWNIDPDTLFISGEVTTYFKTTKPSVSQITFDLSNVLIVDSIRYHSANIIYSQPSNNTLIVNLPSSLSLNQLDSISIYYHGNPPQGSGFGSFTKGTHNGTPIIWTLSEPYGAREWWPCKNNLSDKIDSIDVYITTPQQYRAASNGLLVSITPQGSNNIYHWKHRYPIATYLIAAAVTNYQTFSLYAHIGSDSIEIFNHTYPEYFVQGQSDAQSIVNVMELYDSLFIPYPFIKERYGMTQFGWGGGMEHQTNTFINSFAYEVMAHELAHQWTGDMITCGNWHEIWLNEGFATYWTGLSYEHLFNGYYWPIWKHNQISYITSQPDGSVYCADTTDVNRVFDSRLTYSKGAMILHMLRWVIGDSAFYAGMKGYLTDTNLAYNYACSDDFITHMETASGKNLTEFFSDWLYNQGYPIYAINCSLASTTDDIQVTINQTQSDPSVSFFKLPVPLKFKDATHDTIIVFDNTFSGQQYTINPGFKPDSILFDPELWIVSANDTVIMNTIEYSLQQNILVYPNPVTDFLQVHFSGYHFQHAEIYDIRGMLVRSANQLTAQGELKIKMSDLANGIYFLKATFDNKDLIRKITKM
jgi:aminopeptidase N